MNQIDLTSPDFYKIVEKDLVDLFYNTCGNDELLQSKVTWILTNACDELKANFLICELYNWTHMNINFWQQVLYVKVLGVNVKTHDPKSYDELLKCLGYDQQEEEATLHGVLEKLTEEAAVSQLANEMNAKMELRKKDEEIL